MCGTNNYYQLGTCLEKNDIYCNTTKPVSFVMNFEISTEKRKNYLRNCSLKGSAFCNICLESLTLLSAYNYA
jgi:hypothetical protein